jgi:hypothetical protein
MNKEAFERAIFQSFLQLSDQSFDRYESAKPPEPDIAAWRGDSCFGIEITNFYRRSERARESEEDKLVDLARQYYQSKGGIHVQVDISWSPHFRILSSNSEQIATKVAALVEAHVPPLRKLVNLDCDSFDAELVNVLHRVTINRLVDHKQNSWSADRGGWVPSWQEATLQKELDRKKGKRARYQQSYAEVWLLLVSTFGEPSSWLEMTDSVRDSTYESEFDRVFLLSSFPHAVFEIHLRSRI